MSQRSIVMSFRVKREILVFLIVKKLLSRSYPEQDSRLLRAFGMTNEGSW